MITKIKIGNQRQAGKAIYLLPTGSIECGRFRYDGRYKKDFKLLFSAICSLAHTPEANGVLDVAEYRHWDARDIYDDYVVARWVEHVSAKQLEKFARETQIFCLLEPVRAEFKRSLGLKWSKQFRQSDVNDPAIPRQAWQIL